MTTRPWLYREVSTKRLVLVFYVTPRSHTGGWYEVEDYYTRERKRVNSLGDYVRVAML